MIKLMMALIFCIGTYAHAGLDHFTSDGCSAFPDGTWRDCCFTHDISYWMGGTSEEKVKADEIFKQCVNKKQPGLGYVTYAGVWMGGSPSLPTTWRWGYGWTDGRSYKQLTKKEKAMVADELDRSCFYGKEQGLIYRFMKLNKIPMKYMNNYLLGR